MNVKKYLKKQAEQDLKALETDSDREFLARLKESVAKNPKLGRNKNWLWAIPSSVAVCAAILVGTLVPLSGGGNSRYQTANFISVDSDLTAFFEATDNLTVRFADNQVIGIQKTYDSVSGDDIYYTFSINEVLGNAYYRMETIIVVNDKYEYDDFLITKYFVTKTNLNYSVIYYQTVTADSDTGLNLVKCNAKIENSKYDIFVTHYEEYSSDNGMFLTVIDNLFDFS